jgi:hypothetical protein
MTRLALIQPQLEMLAALAETENRETAGVGFVVPATNDRFIVRDLAPVPDAAYAAREASRIALKPQFCMEIANRARVLGYGVLLAHTHPHGAPEFSPIDNAGEVPLREYFYHRVAGDHFSLVVTGNSARARLLGQRRAADIQIVGRVLRRLPAVPAPAQRVESTRYDRQLRAFGAEGQAELSSLRVGIVGLGGTGSIVARELAHLGVQDFILIDPDRVDETNLNRLLGALPSDRGQAKVHVAARGIAELNSHATITTLVEDVVDADVATTLLNADFIFSCTDSQASRVVLNQIAYQYLIPCIDMGVAIHVHDRSISHISGRVQMLSPGLPCMTCLNWLDSDQIRVEMMTPQQRAKDPYFVGHSQPHPAVISLNGIVASAAVTMFLSAAAGLPSEARMLIYDAMRGSMRPTVMTPEVDCIVCSRGGALARGATWQLPTRHAARGD